MEKQSISRQVILTKIFKHFIAAFQWGNDNIGNRLEEFKQAEALIELLEADDCGSYGGYDPNNPCKRITGFDLFDRFLTVIRKYNKYDDLKEYCGETVKSLVNVAKKNIER